MYSIFTYIGVVSGVNVGIYASPMDGLGIVKWDPLSNSNLHHSLVLQIAVEHLLGIPL